MSLHRLLFALPPETAHGIAIEILKTGLVPRPNFQNDPIVQQNVWGLNFANPLGTAAGLDKNGEIIHPLMKLGFGWVESGTFSPKAQAGNPKPRMVRAIAQEALINRMGFPNEGLAACIGRVKAAHVKGFSAIHAINLVKNKLSVEPDEILADYMACIKAAVAYANLLVINVSSPNMPGLRDLQHGDYLRKIVTTCQQAMENLRKPLLVKIAPDLTDEQLADIIAVAMETKLDGLVVHNTALYRTEGLPPKFAAEAGGLSGAPITARANAMMKNVYRATKGQMPLVGVGGIMNGEDAYQRILSGASLLQSYTGFVYKGPALIKDVVETLARRLRADGFTNIQAAVGSNT